MFGRKNKAAVGIPAAVQEAAPVPSRPARPGSVGKQAYEARRAEKAGLPLDKWMAQKERRAEVAREAERAAEQARRKAEAGRPSLLRRLIDRAHRPI